MPTPKITQDEPTVNSHYHLAKLNDWCKSTKDLHIVVRFYGDNTPAQMWCIRVCTNARGMAAPICTVHGEDLEVLATLAMEKSKPRYAEQKSAIQRWNQEANKRSKQQYYADKRDIEAMHHSAGDY